VRQPRRRRLPANVHARAMRILHSLLALCLAQSLWSAQVNCLTVHFNNQRTGENPNETILTPAAVQSGNFGRLFTYGTPGFAKPFGQFMYVANQSIAGGTHNVIYTHDGIKLTA